MRLKWALSLSLVNLSAFPTLIKSICQPQGQKKHKQSYIQQHSVLFRYITSFLWKELYGYRGYTIILMFKTVSLNFNKTAVSVCTCLYLQAFRDKMCLVPARDPPNTGGPKSSGLCLPPSLLCLCNVQQTAGHRR